MTSWSPSTSSARACARSNRRRMAGNHCSGSLGARRETSGGRRQRQLPLQRLGRARQAGVVEQGRDFGLRPVGDEGGQARGIELVHRRGERLGGPALHPGHLGVLGQSSRHPGRGGARLGCVRSADAQDEVSGERRIGELSRQLAEPAVVASGQEVGDVGGDLQPQRTQGGHGQRQNGRDRRDHARTAWLRRRFHFG